MYPKYVKRVFDIVVGTFFCIALFPICLIIGIILLLTNKGRIFFLQKRPGIHQNEITVIKFKTMNDAKDEYGNILPNHQRITRFGSLLRNNSLDELPQLLNVIKGDMSLVGPRPLLFKYIPLYRDNQGRRHEVKPGITGWAQINGRNNISWTKKFEYDLWYVENLSLALDIKILWMTFKKAIRKEGINKSATVTSEPFNGYN